MSRRFGRNQRRRAREALAGMERQRDEYRNAYQLEKGLLRHIRARKEELQHVVDSVENVLGPNFIGLPPREMILRLSKLELGDRFRFPIGAGRAVTMELLQVDVLDDDFRAQLHARVVLADQKVGYAISRPALLTTPASYLAQRIAEEMAPVLLANIRSVLAKDC